MMRRTCLSLIVLLFSAAAFAGGLRPELQEQVRIGYIDANGAFIAEPQFTWGADFREGYAAVSTGKKMGDRDETFLLDMKGVLTPAPKAGGCTTGIYLNGFWTIIAKDGGKTGFMDRNGTVLLEPQFDPVTGDDCAHGMVRVCRDGMYGYVAADGKIAIEPRFVKSGANDEPAKKFNNDLAAVRVDGKWGYIDRKGALVIAPRYDDAGDFDGGLAPVRVDGQYGYIDTTGRMVIAPRFAYADKFCDGLACVAGNVNGRRQYRFIDPAGRIVFTVASASDITEFHEGLAAFTKEKEGSLRKWGYLDRMGKTVIKPVYASDQKDCRPHFSAGRAMVNVGDGNAGYLDKTGRLVIPPVLQKARAFKDGAALVEALPKELREKEYAALMKGKRRK